MTSRTVYLEGKTIKLAPALLVGQGGEAEIYDLGDGRVLKWWKPADHPDYAGDAAASAAATRRIAEHQRKLRAFPAGLPAQVIAPGALATAKKASAELVGFAMAKVAGEPLHHVGEVKWRRDRGVTLGAVAAALRELHAAVTGLHRAGVVIGDFNDLNVLVDDRAGSIARGPQGPRVLTARESPWDGARAHVIDADSFQLPGFPCTLFSHRFVDPRLCDPAATAPALIRHHDRDSDWFAFAVMAFRSLLGVSPYGGVHRPTDPKRAIAAAARSLRGISVFDPDVVYPRAALPWSVLPDDLVSAFHAVFVQGKRDAFPRRALDGLRFARCATCGVEHARGACPACTVHVSVPIAINGALRIAEVGVADVALTTHELATRPGANVWLAGGALMRQTAFGPERIGDVLAGQTRAWVGARLGVGFYRAGGLTAGFVFRPDRRGLDDRVKLPPIRGVLVRATATIADARAWLATTTAYGGRLTTTVVAIDADGTIAGAHTSDGDDWLAGIAGACAIGSALFVPTDDGVARIECDTRGGLHVARTFPDTRVAVAAGDSLHLGPGALDVVRGARARRLHLS